ncbi:MAG: hypothetical protein WC551_07575 [Patescibacteria group bacterium]
MADEVTPVIAPTPVASPPPAPTAAPAPVATAEPTPAAHMPVPGEPGWLKSRLDQARQTERNAILAELGLTDMAAAKTAVDTASAAANYTARLAQLEAVAKVQAGNMLMGLTEQQQAAVKALAGDDPAKQMQTIMALQPTWGPPPPLTIKSEDLATKMATAGTIAASSPPAPVQIVPGATTAPPPIAPAGASAAPPDHRAIYEVMSETNPFAAAEYGALHPEIYTPRT